MLHGFIPDTGKPRPTDFTGLFLAQKIRDRFWYDTIRIAVDHIKYIYDSPDVYSPKEEITTQIIEPTKEINCTFLDDTFDKLPDEAKTLMNITEYLIREFNGCMERFSTITSYENGCASYKFMPIAGRYGEMDIIYSWGYNTEGFPEVDKTEKYSIPGIIYHNHRYYGITPEFLDWCQTPGKPLRANWFRQLTFAD